MARIQSTQQQRRVKQNIAQQMDKLRDYRERQAKKQHIDEQASKSRRIYTPRDGCEPHKDISGLKSANRLSEIRLHEERWIELENRVEQGHSISYQDIPWPAGGDMLQYLQALAELEMASNSSQGTIKHTTYKKAYAKASLRWHPDKFISSWGSKLLPRDKERIVAHINHLAQELITSRREIQSIMQP